MVSVDPEKFLAIFFITQVIFTILKQRNTGHLHKFSYSRKGVYLNPGDCADQVTAGLLAA